MEKLRDVEHSRKINLDVYSKITSRLNDEFQELADKIGHEFIFETNGFDYTAIKFAGVCIWNSESDERYFYDYLNEFESLEEFCKRKIKHLFNLFNL